MITNYIYRTIAFIFLLTSCKKYLDAKPDKSLVVISTLQDCQSLFDNSTVNNNHPGLLLLLSDEYYMLSVSLASKNETFRNNYVWDPNATDGGGFQWYITYLPIYFANVVLDFLPKVKVSPSNINTYNSIKGQALFHRAFSFYHATQLWCRPYSATASTDLGIPLRLSPDIDEVSVRSTIQQTYDQIINDLKEAANLLPEITLSTTRPNKAAAFGALSRTYLSMGDYINAGRYADSCLKRFSKLIDYNTLNVISNPAFTPNANPEEIFKASINGNITLSSTTALIDTVLYKSYDNNDLRKVVFFFQNSNGYAFKANYNGYQDPFLGIATDEIYLTRAECSARAGLKDSAMADLNRLLVKRWKTGTFILYTAIDDSDALSKILAERRKELLYRGIRWMDLRRLNLEGANITLKRIVDGLTYTLPPNDLRWVLLIPLEVISTTGIQQNPR